MLTTTSHRNPYLDCFKKIVLEKILSLLVLASAIALSLPKVRHLIESSMAVHMLVQMPLLILAGYLIHTRPQHSSYKLTTSAAQWLWIYLTSMFWMLPISLDKALIYPAWDVFKIVSLLITGAVLKLVFQSYRLLALFFIGSMVMMLFFVGFNYQQSDVRLCNAYLIESQQLTGTGLIIVASSLLLFLFWKIKQELAANEFNQTEKRTN